jgi:hypothetical protein
MKKCLYFLKILKESGDSFITGKVLLQICITENCFQKHFRLTKVSTNRKPALRLWTFFFALGENFPDKRSGSFSSNSTNLLF